MNCRLLQQYILRLCGQELETPLGRTCNNRVHTLHVFIWQSVLAIYSNREVLRRSGDARSCCVMFNTQAVADPITPELHCWIRDGCKGKGAGSHDRVGHYSYSRIHNGILAFL